MILSRTTRADGAIMAIADFAGEQRQICLNYLPDMGIGEWTIVHAGFALTRLTPEQANDTLNLMRESGLLDPLPDEPDSAAPAGAAGTLSATPTPARPTATVA